MYDTYYDSAEGIEISKKRAKIEVIRHDGIWADFIAEVGERDIYDAQEVLDWLGY